MPPVTAASTNPELFPLQSIFFNKLAGVLTPNAELGSEIAICTVSVNPLVSVTVTT